AGIRDFHVTGVQTCALPIWHHPMFGQIDNDLPLYEQVHELLLAAEADCEPRERREGDRAAYRQRQLLATYREGHPPRQQDFQFRSEERRVGKEWRGRRTRSQ